MFTHGWSKYAALLLLMAILAGCSGTGRDVSQWKELAELKEATGRVVRVTHGETFSMNVAIRCFIDGRIKDIASVRYIGIDTPEKNEPFYHSARELNKSLVYGKRVKLVFDEEKVDGYGRLLSYVYVDDLFVNAEMVSRGYARASRTEPNTRYADLFQTLQTKAKEQKIGIWSISEPEETVKDSEQIDVPIAGEYKFVASKSSEVFHIPSCPSVKKIASEKLYFRSYKEAVESDRRPCKVCRPKNRLGGA